MPSQRLPARRPRSHMGHRRGLRRVRISGSRPREGTGMADDQAVEQEDEHAEASGDHGQDQAEASGDEGQDQQSEESQKAQEKEEERESARERMDEIEEDPPANLEDWPDDAAKYETFGGPEGEHSYEEGPGTKLGPSSLRHHEGGGVSVAGEGVVVSGVYKGDPIPVGPTDPEAPQDLTTQKIREDQGRQLESEKNGNGENDEGGHGDESRNEDEDH